VQTGCLFFFFFPFFLFPYRRRVVEVNALVASCSSSISARYHQKAVLGTMGAAVAAFPLSFFLFFLPSFPPVEWHHRITAL